MRLLSCLFILAAVLPSSAGAVDFSKEVYPVLQRACFECHGPEKQKGDLRLDTKAAVTHKAIVAGKPDESDLIRRVSLAAGDKEAMPKRGDRLKPTEVEHLRQWIAAGAMWPEGASALKHWSYIKPVRSTLPKVSNDAWCKTDVDRFILARLDAEGIKPAAEAAPSVLIRRLSLDLTGLPPSQADVQAFETDYRANANASVEQLVNRLLDSKEFGVRWARPWLDLARYADSHGYQRDDLRDIWAYRDWVVNALNADKPFDQFTIEQVAGDLLPNATPDQIIATGFHRCTPTNVEAGTEPEESRINQVIDRVNTTGAVWLGTTMECAQCHNHKYDPITQRDYYGLLAYFNNTEKEADRANPAVPGSIKFNGTPFAMTDSALSAKTKALKQELAAVDQRIAERQKASAGKSAAGTSKTVVLKPSSFIVESGADYDAQDDGSLLLTGDVADKDTYTFEAELGAGSINAVMIEALTHPSLPGNGPGRGAEKNPNFVLKAMEASLTTADGKTQPLDFSDAFASFSQKGFDAGSLISKPAGSGWAIMPAFHQPHWAVFALKQPLTPSAGSKLRITLAQTYGGGRTIGCLRISTISGDVASAFPTPPVVVAAQPVKAKGKRGKAAATETAIPIADVQLASLTRQKTALQKQLADLKPATTEVMHELPQPRMTSIFKRGEYTNPGDAVTASTPEVLGAKLEGAANRLTLARWLVSKENPLTARVIVNRWWAEIFGRGLVTTIEDFGIKGEPPTHPELLDTLAIEFMEHGWSMKHILKLLVTSAAYRQQSEDPNGEHYALRAALYAQGPRFRLDAEMVRDNALAIAGLIDLKKGGPPIRPPQPDGLWKKVGGQDYKYEVSPGTEQYRRGLYVVLKRGSPYPSFMNFDASARMACVLKRSRSNTPLQALTLLNDPVYVEATKAFARRIMKSAPSADLDARIEFAFRTALARAPQPNEATVLKNLWSAQFDAAKVSAKDATELVKGFDLQGLTPAEFAAWYAVASALLNLDECITKG